MGQFVTGQVLRVDLHTGTATIVNAGHPFPLRLRDGRVEEIELEIDMPFGMEPGRSFRLQQFPLRAGDRIVFVTDGSHLRDDATVVCLDWHGGPPRQRNSASGADLTSGAR